jgi:diguanylate cyclase (GGDEF)-like protein/PAS domain S-box-containing protein
MARRATVSKRPDLLLLEMTEDVRESYALCEHLQGNTLTQDLPMIFLSTWETSKTAAALQSLQLECADYLKRPYHLEEIGRRIRQQLKWQRETVNLRLENQKLKHKIHLLESSHQISADNLEQISLLKSAIAATRNGLVITDALQKEMPIIYVNQGFEKMTGYSSAEVVGKNCRFLHGTDTEQLGLQEISEAIAAQRECCVTVRNYRRDGTLFWNEISLSPVFDREGMLTHYIGVQTDVSDRKLAEEELQRSKAAVQKMNRDLRRLNDDLHQLANQDGLTGVANRRRFDDYLAQEWARSQREQQPLSLVLGDIDYFKRYNDTYNHLEGDDCLKSVAQGILNCVRRPTDLVARWGGEEFAIILPNTPSQGAMTVAETIRQSIADLEIPHASSAVANHVTMSLGVATLIPTENCSLTALKEMADEALYLAKDGGRNRAICLG